MAAYTPPNPDTPKAGRSVVVLSISHLEETHSRLRGIFEHTNWKVVPATSARQGLELLRRRAIGVVICEKDLPDGTWTDVLQAVQSWTEKPLLIVTSRHADERLWGEVLNLGGYDVLAMPFDPVEVTRVVSIAWLHWQHTRKPEEREITQAAVFGAAMA